MTMNGIQSIRERTGGSQFALVVIAPLDNGCFVIEDLRQFSLSYSAGKILFSLSLGSFNITLKTAWIFG